MTSQIEQKKITIHLFPNISRSKGNQTMKFGQLLKYNARKNIFVKNHTEIEAGKLIPDLLFMCLKKASGQHLSFNIFRQTLTETHNKNTLFQTVNPQICTILILMNGSGNSFSTTFCVFCQETYFSFYILLTNHISLSGCPEIFLEILSNMYIVIICCPVCEVINFEINLQLSYEGVFLNNQKVRTTIQIFKAKRNLNVSTKKKKEFLRFFKF